MSGITEEEAVQILIESHVTPEQALKIYLSSKIKARTPLAYILQEVKIESVDQAMYVADGNKSEAARVLQTCRNTLTAFFRNREWRP